MNTLFKKKIKWQYNSKTAHQNFCKELLDCKFDIALKSDAGKKISGKIKK